MNEVLNVLCLEDSPRDAEIMRELMIDAGYNLKIDCTASEKEYVSLLRSHKYDLILADFKLPGFDGFTALRWSVEICPDVPFICISGTIGEETAVELLKKGAVDYIMKDRLIRLPSAIQRAIEQHNIQIEKRAAELLLKENEEKLQSIFSAAPVGIGLVVGRIFIEVNDTFCRMTGYNRMELIGKDAETMYAEDEQNESAGIVIYRHIAEKGTGSVETRFKCKDGRVLNIFLSSTPLDKDDLSKGVTFIAMDITERVYAEEKLKSSLSLLNASLESTADGILIVDGKGSITKWNRKFTEMWEIPEKILDKHDDNAAINHILNKLTDPDKFLVIVKDLYANPEKSSFDKLEFKNGSIFERYSHPQKIEDTIVGRVWSFRDVTDKMNSEIEIRKLYMAIESSGEAIFITDLDGLITYINPGFTNLYGFSADEVIGKTTPRILKSGVMTPENYKNFWTTILNKQVVKGELINKTKDGRLLNIENSANPIFNDQKEIIGFIGIQHDITERKLAEEQLINAKEKAEEGDRLKTAFLHNISHEIRTPMNAIVGFSALLLGKPDVDAQSGKDYIEVIMQSSNHLLSIISDIVDIANIEANLVKVVKNEINVNSTFQSLFNQFIPKANEKEIQLVCKTGLSDSDALILTDSTKLTQILTNLISNAFKFTDKGYIKIGCELKDKFLEFSVSDTGIGIHQESHQKIFDRFYQVQHTISRLYEGTGLGLAISKYYVELLGGQIWLSSEPGSGTSFYFTIPYEKQVLETLAVNEKRVPEYFAFPEKKTILVAEDTDSNFKLIRFFLSGTNSDILRAENGKEAVEKLNSNKNIDLILMDIKMPVMDGYTAVKLIRETNNTIPIIAQTAYAEDKEKAIESGCSGFISKPFDKKSLLKVIYEFI